MKENLPKNDPAVIDLFRRELIVTYDSTNWEALNVNCDFVIDVGQRINRSTASYVLARANDSEEPKYYNNYSSKKPKWEGGKLVINENSNPAIINDEETCRDLIKYKELLSYGKLKAIKIRYLIAPPLLLRIDIVK